MSNQLKSLLFFLKMMWFSLAYASTFDVYAQPGVRAGRRKSASPLNFTLCRMITNRTPEDWKTLQTEVGRILSECGFSVEIERKIESTRGAVELDVYAEETIRGRRYAIACECKHWKSRIPQTVIHGFRTVVQEIGANVGYIVSLEGFQSGAIAASELTNLQLVTWQEFQLLFEESWYEEFFTHEIDRKLDGLMTYAEPFLPLWFEKMSEGDKEAYFALKERYDLFGTIMQSLGPYTRVLHKTPIPTLPLRARLKPDPILATIPDHILDETAYREFLDASILYGEAALAEFRVLRDRYAA
jgi:restriction system protein